jgi:prepilin-type N-terminal cleavage/methylation domain-containing protein
MRLMPRRSGGFSLVELAVVLAVVGLLLGSLMYTLQAQQEQRAREETQRRLEQAREALLGFAVANGRLPCPASAASSGVESDNPTNSNICTNPYDGFLPAVTLGFGPVDSEGFAVDAWNNRIRYAVAAGNPLGCLGTSTAPHLTSKVNLKQNGMSCLPNTNDLLVCKSAATSPAPAPGSCGPAGNIVTNNNPTGAVVAVVFSPGKNHPSAPTAAEAVAALRVDEAANLDGNSVFIAHTPQPSGASGGEYDDLVLWIPIGLFYGRMVAAGVLP